MSFLFDKRLRAVQYLVVGLSLGVASCDEGVTPAIPTPTIAGIRVEANPSNVLAAVVTVEASGGSEGLIQYVDSSGAVGTTPPVRFSSGSARIDVLGLRPQTTYSFRVIVAANGSSSFTSTPILFTTGALPSDLPKLAVISSALPTPGFVLIGISPSQPSPKAYALIVDNVGNVVWYKRFVTAVADFQKQPNGHYTAYSSLDGGPSRFYEMDHGGRVLRELTAVDPLNTDAHELRIVGDQRYLFGVELRTMDLSALGGLANATVRGISVERSGGSLNPFNWTTFDHFEVSDAAADIPLTSAQVNPWHGNAMEIEADGNILASFRNADVIAKIDATTGAVIWRWGGKNNEFTFVNDPLNGFSHQHGIRRLPNGHIIMFDNGNLHNPPVSRGVEYALDETAKTATLVWEYRGRPELYSFAVGNAQRLSSGNTLICFGIAQRVLEVDPSGVIEWELAVDEPNHYPYRAFRIDSLY